MFIALVGNDGFIDMIGPQVIRRVAPLAAGSVVTLADRRRMPTQDDLATLRRRVWVAGLWHATCHRWRWLLRQAVR